MITTDVEEMPEVVKKYKDVVQGRCMLVKKLRILPVEAIVRGYITGIVVQCRIGNG
jgi:phosphoribosylaminoimidazole-succinocarboxamide synthase